MAWSHAESISHHHGALAEARPAFGVIRVAVAQEPQHPRVEHELGEW